MGKPAELGALVKRQQASTSQSQPETHETPAPPRPRTARAKPEPEIVKRDLGPPRKLSFNCPSDVYLALKIHSAHSGELHQDIIARALSEWLAKHGMRG
jgi:hypothetical protein